MKKKPAELAREQRRVIVVLSDEALRNALRDEELVEVLDDPEALVLGVPGSLDEGDEFITRLSDQNLLRPGVLLVQNPYNSLRYETAGSAAQEFAVEKFTVLTRLCKLLGATSVEVQNINEKARDEHWRGDATVKAVLQGGEVSTDLKLSDRVRERLQLKDTFPGDEPDIDAARELLRTTGLQRDSTLDSLVANRDGRNALSRREITVSLTQEASQNLHVAAKYSNKLVKVETNVTRDLKENIDVTVSAVITF